MRSRQVEGAGGCSRKSSIAASPPALGVSETRKLSISAKPIRNRALGTLCLSGGRKARSSFLVMCLTESQGIWYAMHMNRTVRIPLQATPEQADALAETTRLFTDAFNTVCAYGWEHGETNGVHLHHATYYACKSAAPALVSDLHIQARVKATEAIKSALTLKRKSRKISPPMADACPPRYNVNTFKVDWNTRRVRLSTAQGRMSLPFHVPEYATAYVGGKVATADLIQHDGAWRLHIVVDIPAPIVQATDEIMGVELCLAQLAGTTTNQFLG